MVAILLSARPGILLALDLRILVPGLYLAGSLLLAALIIAVCRRIWRTGDERPPSPSDEMAHYRTLYEQGTISEEEYRRLRGLLGGELRRSVDLLPAPAPTAPKSTDKISTDPPSPSPDDTKPPPDGIRPA
jgi:hypothetical protein